MESEIKKILAIVDDVYEDLELWYPCRADIAYYAMKTAEFDALLVPGGFAPDKMRRRPEVLDVVREMNRSGKLIALISAGILRGRHATSTVGIRDDMVNAGALWADKELVRDGNLISSRTPADLHVFAKAIVDWLKEPRQ